MHIYAFFGRVCDGLLRLQLISDAEEARRLRNRVVVDYLAALRGVQVAEDNVADNLAVSPGPAGVEATTAPERPSRVMDTTTLPAHSRAGSG